ncbi:MAG: glycosyltransferase family 2 protein [Chloroflexi bacterium]|nr:glycosyltransferase family 2 protein [Chloroflexota bacterium]
MDLSIIIVNWNTRDLLRQCLSSIFADPPGIQYEVWVVDNASSDDSVQMVRRLFPQVQVIENPTNLGFARANNHGLELARARYALLLNSDTIVLPGALQELVRVANLHPEAGIVGCMLLNSDGSLQESWASFPTLWSEVTGRNIRTRRSVGNTTGLYDVDWVGGACLLAQSQAIRQVGLLDESYFMYSEEMDWCYRMRRCGWRVYYSASAKVVHLGGGSASRASASQLIRLYDSKIRFFQTHYGARSAGLLRFGLITVNTAALARRSLTWAIRHSKRVEVRNRLSAQYQLLLWLILGNAQNPHPNNHGSDRNQSYLSPQHLILQRDFVLLRDFGL